ncbi:hypothetical protein AOLI_G00307830 [Acnodon oligacanthus]
MLEKMRRLREFLCALLSWWKCTNTQGHAPSGATSPAGSRPNPKSVEASPRPYVILLGHDIDLKSAARWTSSTHAKGAVTSDCQSLWRDERKSVEHRAKRSIRGTSADTRSGIGREEHEHRVDGSRCLSSSSPPPPWKRS